MTRVLPHSLDTEAALLGAVMTDPACLRRLKAIAVETFYSPKHQAIWTAIARLDETSQPIDPVTIEAELARLGKSQAVGGLAAVGEIYIQHSSVSSVDAYAATLIELWNSRSTDYDLRPVDDAVVQGHQAVADTFLQLGVLDGPADLLEEREPVLDAQVVLVAVLDDGVALDEFHDEERAAGVGRASVEDAGDVGVVHERQRLPLGREAADHLASVHAGLDDFDRDPPYHRMQLLGRRWQFHFHRQRRRRLVRAVVGRHLQHVLAGCGELRGRDGRFRIVERHGAGA